MNYAQTVITAFGLNKTEGDIALELEVEGRNLPSINTKLWTTHTDGSLKLGGMEYVHNGPKMLDEVYESLKNFEDRLVKKESTVYESERTSVHAHLNMQDKTIKQVLQAATAYYMLEPALMNLAGEKRKGNLFCLTMEAAPKIVDFMKALANGSAIGINTDQYRYASLNFGALKKFGSLEVRTMRGFYDPDYLTLWSKGLRSLFDKAGSEFKSPVEVLDSWYGRTKDEFLSQFFEGDFIDEIKKHDWEDRLDRNHKTLKFLYDIDFSKKEEDFPKNEIPVWATIPNRPVRIPVNQLTVTNPFIIRELRASFKQKVLDVLRAWYPNLNIDEAVTELSYLSAVAAFYTDVMTTDGTRYYMTNHQGRTESFDNAKFAVADLLERDLRLLAQHQALTGEAEEPEDDFDDGFDELFVGDLEE